MRVVGIVALVLALGGTWNALGLQLFLDLTVAGLTFGSIAALSGVGVVVTYKATGVFNFAHGAVAVAVAYVLWQMNQEWGIPVGIAAPVAMLVVAPMLGIGLERVVFRPLAQRQASTAESLVATIGVFVVLLGLMTAVWGLGTKTNPVALFPGTSMCLGACADGADGLVVRLGVDQLLTMVTLALVTLGLWWLFARSTLGTDIKAVVDRRELAQLTAVNADRVSATAWALGATFAGLTGVLLAPVATGSLDPFRLTLLVVETFAVAVVARLTSLPRAVVAGLAIGLAASYLTQFSFAYPVTWFGDLTGLDVTGAAGSAASALDQLLPSLPVVVFLGALLFMRKLDGIGDDAGSGSFVARMTAAGTATVGRANAVAVLLLSVVAVTLPFAVRNQVSLMADAHEMLALAIIFLSIVVVTGFSGHITLAQAGFGGVGALVAARSAAHGVPVVLSIFVGGLACIPIGLGAGYPALRRRGLFLGLTTLALGLVLERGVLQNLYFLGSSAETTFDAPTLFGLDLGGGVAFWYYELVVLVLMVILARNLQRSRIGRVLGAMRDSEMGARSVALNLQTYKLFVFAVGAFMAGVGGALLSQSRGGYGEQDFVTINGLLWFAVVVVAGVGSIYGAVFGAFLFTLLGSLLGESGLSTLIVGLAAVFLGRLPGGLVGGIKRLVTGGPAALVPREVFEHEPSDAQRRAGLQASPLAVERLRARQEVGS